MLTEPNVLVMGVDAAKQSLTRPTTSLSSSAIGTIGVGGAAIQSTNDSNFKPKHYLSQRYQESFYRQSTVASSVLQNWLLLVDQVQSQTLERYQVWRAYLEVQAKNACQEDLFQHLAALEDNAPLAS